MGLKRQIERLRHWACPQAYDCHDCKYAIHGDWNDCVDEYDDWCPFENVIKAAEDRAKEVQENDKKAVPREVLQKAKVNLFDLMREKMGANDIEDRGD